jgi:D-tyrosyl-tRNA(Tyr) deacylase
VKIVIQRVSRAEVRVEGEVVGKIGVGLVLLVAIERGDGAPIVDTLADKVVNLRIFPDAAGKMNRSTLDAGAALLAVSQFTLAGSLERGRRPSFENAAPPEEARALFDVFVDKLRGYALEVATGRFQAMMEVELVNDGPVTFVLEAAKR